jgi:tetratricopeptide (TPR) repeat protein
MEGVVNNAVQRTEDKLGAELLDKLAENVADKLGNELVDKLVEKLAGRFAEIVMNKLAERLLNQDNVSCKTSPQTQTQTLAKVTQIPDCNQKPEVAMNTQSNLSDTGTLKVQVDLQTKDKSNTPAKHLALNESDTVDYFKKGSELEKCGNVCQKTDRDTAIYYYQKAIKMFDFDNNFRKCGFLSTKIADLYLETNNYLTASHCYDESVYYYYRANNSKSQEIKNKNMYAYCNIFLKNYDLAIKIYHTIISECGELPLLKFSISKYINNIILLMLLKGNKADCFEYLHNSNVKYHHILSHSAQFNNLSAMLYSDKTVYNFEDILPHLIM